MPTKKSKGPGAKPVATGESSKAPVPADPPQSPVLAGQWRTRGLMIAGAAAIGVVGLLIGRASSSVPTAAPVSPASGGAHLGGGPQTPGSSVVPEPAPLHFDLSEDPKFKSGIALRPMDREIFDKLTTLALDRTQMGDVFPDRPYRVRFIGSVAEKRIGLVMVDLNRDGKVDERWDIKSGDITRIVQSDPNANGVEVRYTLSHGRWQPH